ncbi:Cation efflux protein [Candidatus Magnetoovum chiemensis]|nr:Cation efflux protein [Candidatus Magnetoovum chiemensis]
MSIMNNSDRSLQKRQRIVLISTIVYFFIELLGGFMYNSLALVTDASFMAINITGQFIAIYIERISKRQPDNKKTFGYERARVLSGLFNGILLGFLTFYVLKEGYAKILNPPLVETTEVIIIALIGLIVNGSGFLILYRHSNKINVKASMLLILNDTLGSVGVVIAAVVISYTGFYFLDPLAGVIIGLLVAWPTYILIKENVNILMESNTFGINVEEVRTCIYESDANISTVKDIHIWGITPEIKILAVRIRTNGQTLQRENIKIIKNKLETQFGFADLFLETYEDK